MKKNKKDEESVPEPANTDAADAGESGAPIDPVPTGLGNWALQGWVGLAFWMSFGLALEGLIGFRVPDYLTDEVRRELFRLAHAHGTLFSIVLLVAGFFLEARGRSLPSAAAIALRVGVFAMPLGFLLGGIVTYGNDPNPLVFLSPVGGLLVIFGVVTIALVSRGDRG